MNVNFLSLINGISEKLQIKITVYGTDGVNLTDANDKLDISEFDGTYSDKEKNHTVFKVNYNKNGYILKIDGADANSVALSTLIAEKIEKGKVKKENLSRDEFYKNVINGKYSFFEIEEYVKENGIAENEACSMIISGLEEKADEICEVLRNYSNDDKDVIIKLDGDKIAFIKAKDEAVEEYRSVFEYAEFLYQLFNEETGVHAGIYIGSDVKTTADVSESFAQALIAENIGKRTQLSGHVHSYKEFTYIKMLEDLPKYKLSEYLHNLMGSTSKEIFEDKEMLLTAEEFLDNNLNVSETSRKMYLHRNTLTYRLDKIEKATGLDLKKFSDALTFRIIVILNKLVK